MSEKNNCIDEVFLMNFNIFIKLDKEKLLCDYFFNKGVIENEQIVGDLSQKIMYLVQEVLFQECEKNAGKNR